MNADEGGTTQGGAGDDAEEIRRYSPFCLKLPLVCMDDERRKRADRFTGREELSEVVRAALYYHELTDSDGFEFVAFGNVRLPAPLRLFRRIILVPCFTLSAQQETDDPELARLTRRMAAVERFIYDGWLPISDWHPDKVAIAIQSIDEALSAFALCGPISFTWEPKYRPISHNAAYELDTTDLQHLGQVVNHIDDLPEADREAVYRSIGWLAQATRLTDPGPAFLFCIVAVESLATHIEEEADHASPLPAVRSTRMSTSQRRKERAECARAILDQYLPSDPWKAVNEAYFKCSGTQRMLDVHLRSVFESHTELADWFLKDRAEARSLYKLRSQIAHGSADHLNPTERERLRRMVPRAEHVARLYITTVLQRALGAPPLSPSIAAMASASFLDGVYSHQGMYRGPTHLAWVYM